MITVRFPNGQAVQYNDAHYCMRSERYSDLYRASDKDGKYKGWVAHKCRTLVLSKWNRPAAFTIL